MEVIEETPELNASIDQVKNNIVIEETVEYMGQNVVHKWNGVVNIRESRAAEKTMQKIAAVQGLGTLAINENISSQSDHKTEKGTDQTKEPNTEITVKDLDKKSTVKLKFR
ncbi:unnamed protein product [Parnassius apollo]|uniref:(apollo) hypothetical protein n=1 Tax=Parnassius apollo TaxID=110799 RepID=A0A8S3Y508_PARAO|nr:unnamed protein product [Parnassius apollo]